MSNSNEGSQPEEALVILIGASEASTMGKIFLPLPFSEVGLFVVYQSNRLDSLALCSLPFPSRF
jgi:hypothetical protein